jgi:hypothetical protein
MIIIFIRFLKNENISKIHKILGISAIIIVIIIFVYQGYKANEIAKEKAIQVAAIARQAEIEAKELKRKQSDFEYRAQQIVRDLENKKIYHFSNEFKNEVKPLIEEATLLYNLTSSQIIDIQYNNLYIGMPTSLLFISWGRPSQTNRTTTISGERIQYVYRNYLGSSDYAYTENGFVTAWQD